MAFWDDAKRVVQYLEDLNGPSLNSLKVCRIFLEVSSFVTALTPELAFSEAIKNQTVYV